MYNITPNKTLRYNDYSSLGDRTYRALGEGNGTFVASIDSDSLFFF